MHQYMVCPWDIYLETLGDMKIPKKRMLKVCFFLFIHGVIVNHKSFYVVHHDKPLDLCCSWWRRNTGKYRKRDFGISFGIWDVLFVFVCCQVVLDEPQDLQHGWKVKKCMAMKTSERILTNIDDCLFILRSYRTCPCSFRYDGMFQREL